MGTVRKAFAVLGASLGLTALIAVLMPGQSPVNYSPPIAVNGATGGPFTSGRVVIGAGGQAIATTADIVDTTPGSIVSINVPTLQLNAGGIGTVTTNGANDLNLTAGGNLNFTSGATGFTPLRLFMTTNDGFNFNQPVLGDANLGFYVDMTSTSAFRVRGSGSNANPTIMRSTGGSFLFYTDTNKTDLSALTPTLRATLNASGLAVTVPFTGAVNTVASSATPAFDLSLGNTQRISALATNATMTVSNIVAGTEYAFVICLDGSGLETFAWAASFHGAMTIGTTASKCNAQKFVSPDGTNLYATSPGVINQ